MRAIRWPASLSPSPVTRDGRAPTGSRRSRSARRAARWSRRQRSRATSQTPTEPASSRRKRRSKPRAARSVLGLAAGRPLLFAAVAEVPRRLAERDHSDEDQADDEHRRDDLLALGGGVLDPEERPQHAREHGHRAATLANAL